MKDACKHAVAAILLTGLMTFGTWAQAPSGGNGSSAKTEKQSVHKHKASASHHGHHQKAGSHHTSSHKKSSTP
jgi:hypothetical protein